MSDWEFNALRAKIKVANFYLNQAFKSRGKVDNYDVYKVITPSMRNYVEIGDLTYINQFGKGRSDIQFVMIREVV